MISPLRVFVIDRDPQSRSLICSRIGEQSDLQLVGVYGDPAPALSAARDTAMDLLLIDGSISAKETVSILSAMKRVPETIIITDTWQDRDHPAKPLPPQIVRPLDVRHIDTAIDRARNASRARRRNNSQDSMRRSFLVKEGDRKMLVPLDTICRIESDGNYVLLHTHAAIHKVRLTLSAVADLLPADFQRIHRGVIVRLSEISYMVPRSNRGHYVYLKCGTGVKLSRSYYDQLIEVGVMNLPTNLGSVA